MQTLDFVSGLHDCLEFSQPLSCLYQAMQTRKTFSVLNETTIESDGPVSLYSIFDDPKLKRLRKC